MKLNRRVTIITRFSGIMFSLLLLGGLAACSDDNNGNDTPEPEPSTYPTTPFSKIELKEVIESDAQPVTATHTYLYNSAGRLTGYTGKQSFTAGDELFEIEDRERCATGYCHPYLSLQQCRQADRLHRQTELYGRRRTLRDREYHYCRIQGPSSRDNRRSRYSINLHAE